MLLRSLCPWSYRLALLVSVGGCWLLATSSQPQADDATPAEVVEPSPRDAFLDPAFDLFVSQQMLEDAVVSGDAALLTDVALQVAHGQDVLQRPRQGIDAAELLRAAIQAAADDGDKALLTRLEHGVKRYGPADLEPVLTAALQLADSERKLAMPPGMDPSEATAESMVIYNAMAKEVRKALQYGSREDIDDIIASLPHLPLHRKQQDHLAKLADQALLAINAKSSDSVLAQLASASRGFIPSPTKPTFVRTIAGPGDLKYGGTGKFTVMLTAPTRSDYTVQLNYSLLSGPKSVTIKKGGVSATISVKAPAKPNPPGKPVPFGIIRATPVVRTVDLTK